ncbi:MAG: TIR domain-containing protein [Verrucomicrobiales bacterium]
MGLVFGDGVDNPSTAKWNKYGREDVVRFIREKARHPNLETLREASSIAARLHDEVRMLLGPLLEKLKSRPSKDGITESLAEKISDSVVHTEEDFLKKWSPRKPPVSRDKIAMAEGIVVPPHLLVKAEIWAIRHPFMVCGELAKTLRWLASHLVDLEKRAVEARHTTSVVATAAAKSGARGIVVGHGKSALWRSLRDRITEVFPGPCHGFQQVPLPGLGTMAAMLEVMPRARFAILVLTRDDVETEGELAAQLNVVRLAGLFQGRLGFSRVLLLVEECATVLPGLHDLPCFVFPEGDPLAIWLTVRAILEKEMPAEVEAAR